MWSCELFLLEVILLEKPVMNLKAQRMSLVHFILGAGNVFYGSNARLACVQCNWMNWQKVSFFSHMKYVFCGALFLSTLSPRWTAFCCCFLFFIPAVKVTVGFVCGSHVTGDASFV